MPGTSSDTYENLKKAFKSLFRRRKPVGKTPQVPVPPPRLRPRSTSATAAPEAVTPTLSPSWPLLNQSPASGHFHANAVELPGCLAVNPAFPAWQQRSKSDVGVGHTLDKSDFFSELDSSSVRRESVIGILTPGGHVQELESPSVDQHIMPRFESQQESQSELDSASLEEAPEIPGAPETPEALETSQATLTAEVIPEEAVEDEDEDEETEQKEQPEEKQEDELENEPVPQPELGQIEATKDVTAEPKHEQEREQEHEEEDVSQVEETSMDTEESDETEHTIVSAISIEDIERNDSAICRVVKDDSSSTYSTDDSAEDDSASDDEGAPSTPRTSSVAQTESVEYFDEKIPVLSEPPPVIRLTPAPGMAATSGPLEDFPY